MSIPTYKEFKHIHKTATRTYMPMWKRLFISYDPITFQQNYTIPDIYTIGFIFHVRVPGEDGYFKEGGNWCFPWNWYKQYYEKRFKPQFNG
jgi:hypothetical protein